MHIYILREPAITFIISTEGTYRGGLKPTSRTNKHKFYKQNKIFDILSFEFQFFIYLLGTNSPMMRETSIYENGFPQEKMHYGIQGPACPGLQHQASWSQISWEEYHQKDVGKADEIGNRSQL